MNQLRTIYSLARLNTQEWIRLKFFHIIIFFGILFIAFSHLLSSLTFSVQERLLYDFGLGSLELVLMMMACLIGSHAIHREIERKTMFVLLARPIHRSSVIIGAWGAISILCTLFMVGFLLSLFVTASGEIPYRGVLISSFISLLKSMVIGGVAIAFGLLVRPLLALVAAISYWILCYSILDIEFFVKKIEDADDLIRLVGYAKKLFPEFYTYNWKSYFFTQNVPLSSEVAWAALHSLCWISVWLFLACQFFKRKEIV